MMSPNDNRSQRLRNEARTGVTDAQAERDPPGKCRGQAAPTRRQAGAALLLAAGIGAGIWAIQEDDDPLNEQKRTSGAVKTVLAQRPEMPQRYKRARVAPLPPLLASESEPDLPITKAHPPHLPKTVVPTARDVSEFDLAAFCTDHGDLCMIQDGKLQPNFMLTRGLGIGLAFLSKTAPHSGAESAISRSSTPAFPKQMPRPPAVMRAPPPEVEKPPKTPTEAPDITPYYTDKFHRMFTDVLNSESRIGSEESQWLLWMLKGTSSDPNYMYALRSSLHLSCADFIDGVTNLANDYEDDSEDKKAWANELQALGMEQNEYHAWVWYNVPRTLKCE